MKVEIMPPAKPEEELKPGELFTAGGEVYIAVNQHQGEKALGHVTTGTQSYGLLISGPNAGRIHYGFKRMDCQPLTGTGKDGALQLKLK